MSFRYLIHGNAIVAGLLFAGVILCPVARGAQKDKDKEKPEKEKKEKIEPWVEIRTPHFIVASDGGEKTARRFADEFETLLRIFQATMPGARVTNGVPVLILAARDNQSFARMAPEFPYDKKHIGREQPPGLMFSGAEKTYIGIRANASGRFPHAEIFQNYSREILKRSYRGLPPWLEEGYSTVYSNLTFGDRGVRMERPDPDDLSILFESPLLPLDIVLAVNRDSPYYSPGNKGSVYFAESRVLLHYLISDAQFTQNKALERYVTAVQAGTDQMRAARDAFGDLSQLQAKLDAYVKNVSGPAAEIPSSGGGDSGGSPRTMSAAEIEARLADFMSLRGKSEDAEDKLNEAIMSEPSLAEAEQDLGYLMLKQNNLDDAQKHFERAAQLDPKDALNFYGQGLVAMERADKGTFPPAAAEAFEKTVALNSEFAPAFFNLATIYSQRPESLQKALDDAKRAAALAPGDSSYQRQVASLQEDASHPQQSSRIIAHADEAPSSRGANDKATSLSVRKPPPPPPPVSAPTAAGNAPAKPPADAGVHIERKTEVESSAPAASTAAAASAAPTSAPVPPLFTESEHLYSMVGTITEVNCASAPQVQVTLKSQSIVMKLHADSLDKLSIKAAQSGAKAATCASLRGRNARISYLFVSGKAWDAEMQSVEFR